MTQKDLRMIAKRIRRSSLLPLVLIPVLAVLAWARGVSSGVGDAWGPFYKAPAQPRAASTYSPQQGTASTSWVRRWNEIAIDASGLDHTPVAPGEWRQDPISQLPVALGAYWGGVKPFVLHSADQFRVPPPPALDGPQYAAAFDEVKRLGGDGSVTPTVRTEDQTIAGIYWAYDGTPSLCAPPRLYNHIAVTIADRMGSDTVGLARLLALANVAMADAGIAIWESKYYYQFWRPVTGIGEADPGTGPTGAGDGNPATVGDPTFMPLGAPASNLAGPNFTPPFPSYPSGHGAFGGALFQILRKFYGTSFAASNVLVSVFGFGALPSVIASERILPSICCCGVIPRMRRIVGARSTFPLGKSSVYPQRKSGPAAINMLCMSNRLSVACVPFPAARCQSASITPGTPN